MASPTVRDLFDERVTAFDESTTVADAIDAIRTSTNGASHTVYYAYVLDEDGVLTGVVSLRELLNADDGTEVATVKTEPVVSLDIDTPIHDCGKTFTQNEFTMLPVVNDDQALVGILHSNTIIEELDDRWSKKVLKATVRDIEYDPGQERAFECFGCGTIITATDNPGTCPNCGEELRNRKIPLE